MTGCRDDPEGVDEEYPLLLTVTRRRIVLDRTSYEVALPRFRGDLAQSNFSFFRE